jgi:spermidine synthase
VQARLNDPAYVRVADSLREVGFGNAIQLLASYAGQASDLQPWLQDAAINRDGNLRLQYLAGLALNRDEQNAIYGEMLAYRTYPQNLFQASDTDRDQLMWAIRAGGY